MDAIFERKSRSKNFTSDEEDLLMELVKQRQHVVQNKKCDAETWKRKQQAWRQMAEKFAAKTGSHRSAKALREKFAQMKRVARRNMRKGDVPERSRRSDASRKILEILRDTDAKGLDKSLIVDDPLDVDAEYANSEGEGLCQEHDEEEDDVEEQEDDSSDFQQSGTSLFKPLNVRSVPKKEAGTPSSQLHAEQCTPHEDIPRKRKISDENLNLVLLQQEFFRAENKRRQEKHELEMEKERIKLKQEIFRLQQMETQAKLNGSLGEDTAFSSDKLYADD